MGAQLAAPDKQCINVMGDTAVGMAGIDFETAVREKIPSITVILNNSAMGGYEKNIPLAAERYRTKYLTGDYMSMTQSMGSFSQRVEQAGGNRASDTAGAGFDGGGASCGAGVHHAGRAGVFELGS